MDYNPLLISVFVFVTSCQAQSFSPTNLTAVYVADGSIRVTWSPPVTKLNIEKYNVRVQETGDYHNTRSANDRVYQYNTTKPGTTYTFTVTMSTIFHLVTGSSQTTVTTPAAMFRQRGSSTILTLPKPPSGVSGIVFSGRTLFMFVSGAVDGDSTTGDGITVRLTTTNAILSLKDLTPEHAGYYYTMQSSGNVILGGQLLVVTDTPTRPNITPSSHSPVLDISVTLGCISTSRNKPDYHGLVLTYSWKVNGSDVNHDRFSVNGSNLVIDPVRLIDKYNVYTCVAHEDGQGSSRLSSEESSGFQLTPRYGPQFVTIEGAEGRSPLIRGDVYGPVICRTDCNPACVLEWWRQGNQRPVISSRTPSNQLELVDSSLFRTRELTFTCKARVSSSGGFTATPLEKNITVDVYFPPRATALSYMDDVYTYRPIGTPIGDIRYTEGSRLVLSVDIDGNPDPDVTLLRNQTTVAVGVPNTTGKYVIDLDNLQCNHTGRYDVRAANFVTRNRSNVDPEVRTFGLQVSCTPRRQYNVNSVIGVRGETGQTIALDVSVIANPKPTGRWSAGVMSLPVIQNNPHMYSIRGEVNVTTLSDFRAYHVNVTNGVRGMLTVIFEIRPAELPQTASPQPSLTVVILIIVIVILAVALIIAILVKRRRLSQQGQEHIYVNQDQQGSTTNNQRQGGANIHELQERAVQGQEHMYDTVENEISDSAAIHGANKGQEHVYDTANDRDVNSGATNRDVLTDDDGKYTDLEPSRGQEHVYAAANDQQQDKTAVDVKNGAEQHTAVLTGDQNEYTELEPPRGQEHMYDSTTHEFQGSTATRGRQGRAAKDDG